MHDKAIAVFGGSGFIGSYIVQELLKSGFIVNLLTRSIDNVAHLRPLANLGYLNVVVGDIFNKNDLLKVIGGASVVLNCIGTIVGGKKRIHDLNYEFPRLLLDLLNDFENDVRQIVHFSALLHENAVDNYTKSKANARALFKLTKFKVAILNPSVVFGEEDNFFNFFASIAKYFFILPLVNEGRALIQPVYVLDVARFVVKIIQDEECGDFYLVGCMKYSIKDIFIFICTSLNKKRFFINVPNKLMRFIAHVCEVPVFYVLTKVLVGRFEPLITVDQVSLLSFDNTSEINSLLDFGIIPKSVEEIVPSYLEKYR